jgi:adenylate kinase
VLLGKQGAGKGTQAARLGEKFDIAHVSTGDMFRSMAAMGTAHGLEAKRYMDDGDLVPDDLTIGIVEECLAPGGPLADGFVLDGFPRNLHQARELDVILDGRPLDLAINLEVPRDIVLDRLAGRRVCENCQRVYHVKMPPAVDWICDTCGGRVVHRDDDTEEAIDRRLELYEQQTVPIIDYYRESGILARVDGVGEGEVVFERLVKTVEAGPCRSKTP